MGVTRVMRVVRAVSVCGGMRAEGMLRIFEGERASGGLCDAIAALVDIRVMQGAEQREIGQAGLAAVGPVL